MGSLPYHGFAQLGEAALSPASLDFGLVTPIQHCAAESERHRGGCSPPYWMKPGSGWEPTWVGSSSDSACAAKGAPGCMGVAWQKPSYAGEGAASPHWTKAGSGLEPTRVQPGLDSACSAQGAPAYEGKGCAMQGREQCSLQGEALFWQRAHMCGVQPSAGLCARRRARLRRRWARAKQCRAGPGGYSHSPQGEASVGRVPT